MGTDKTKNEAGANVGGDSASIPILGSARGLVEIQSGSKLSHYRNCSGSI